MYNDRTNHQEELKNQINGGHAVEIQFNNRTPVYLQVIAYFKEEIVSGRLESGVVMPSRRELANMLKINPNTVQRAYKEMEELGLIFTDGNLPSQVTKDETIIEAARKELVSELLREFIQSVQAIPIPLDELQQLIKETYEKELVRWEEEQ